MMNCPTGPASTTVFCDHYFVFDTFRQAHYNKGPAFYHAEPVDGLKIVEQ